MEKRRTTTITIDTLEFMHLYQTLKNVEVGVKERVKDNPKSMDFNYFLLFKSLENFERELENKLSEEAADYAAKKYEERKKAFEITTK